MVIVVVIAMVIVAMSLNVIHKLNIVESNEKVDYPRK